MEEYIRQTGRTGCSKGAAMTNLQTDLNPDAGALVCQKCTQHDGHTMYVHLCSGKVKEIAGVTGVRVTQSQLVLERGDEDSVVVPRRDVYYACCNADELSAF
jgi:hypothetical protein